MALFYLVHQHLEKLKRLHSESAGYHVRFSDTGDLGKPRSRSTSDIYADNAEYISISDHGDKDYQTPGPGPLDSKEVRRQSSREPTSPPSSSGPSAMRFSQQSYMELTRPHSVYGDQVSSPRDQDTKSFYLYDDTKVGATDGPPALPPRDYRGYKNIGQSAKTKNAVQTLVPGLHQVPYVKDMTPPKNIKAGRYDLFAKLIC